MIGDTGVSSAAYEESEARLRLIIEEAGDERHHDDFIPSPRHRALFSSRSNVGNIIREGLSNRSLKHRAIDIDSTKIISLY